LADFFNYELEHLCVVKNLYFDIQFSDFGMWSFLFKTRKRCRMWFNVTFMDHQLQIAWEANLHFEFVQNTVGKIYG
jgi:hypothetical protein